MKPLDLSVIIVSYNTKKLLRDCLSSLQQSQQLPQEVIVVDNASTDGSQAMVKQAFPSVKLIENNQNQGFAQANNRGASQAKSNYLLLLNSDTTVFPDTLPTLIEAASQNNAAVATCQLQNPDGSIQPQGGNLPSLVNLASWMLFIDDLPLVSAWIPRYQQRHQGYFEHDHLMGWVGGTALLVSRDFYLKLHGLDEAIFMYAEDVEFCLRVHQAGKKVYYFHQPHLIHLGQGSGTKENSVLGEFGGLKYIYQKHKKPWERAVLSLLLKVGALLRWLIFGMIAGDSHRKRIYAKAFKLA